MCFSAAAAAVDDAAAAATGEADEKVDSSAARRRCSVSRVAMPCESMPRPDSAKQQAKKNEKIIPRFTIDFIFLLAPRGSVLLPS